LNWRWIRTSGVGVDKEFDREVVVEVKAILVEVECK
jgi:hypothetical protein